MEECLSDELNSKMNNLKNSISEHAIEQVQKKQGDYVWWESSKVDEMQDSWSLFKIFFAITEIRHLTSTLASFCQIFREN